MAGGKGKINEYNKSLSANERKANAKKAGNASGVSRQRNKNFKELAKSILNLHLKGAGDVIEPEIANSLREFGLKDKDMTVKVAILLALVKKALDGNINAIEKVMAMVGENADNTPRAGLEDKAARLKNKKLQAVIDWMDSSGGGAGNDSVTIIDDIAGDADAND